MSQLQCEHGQKARRCDLCLLNRAQALVNEQAEDGGLWFVAMTAPEAYLQAALRRLHAVIEGEEPSP